MKNSLPKLFFLAALISLALRGCNPAWAGEVQSPKSKVQSHSCWSIRLMALGQIESGDDDFAVGRDGEVSRYQIKLVTCSEFRVQSSQLTNAVYARRCAEIIATEWCHRFFSAHGRQPSDAEFYRLWNPRCSRDLAQRFANLCEAFNRPDAKAAKIF